MRVVCSWEWKHSGWLGFDIFDVITTRSNDTPCGPSPQLCSDAFYCVQSGINVDANEEHIATNDMRSDILKTLQWSTITLWDNVMFTSSFHNNVQFDNFNICSTYRSSCFDCLRTTLPMLTFRKLDVCMQSLENFHQFYNQQTIDLPILCTFYTYLL